MSLQKAMHVYKYELHGAIIYRAGINIARWVSHVIANTLFD